MKIGILIQGLQKQTFWANFKASHRCYSESFNPGLIDSELHTLGSGNKGARGAIAPINIKAFP